MEKTGNVRTRKQSGNGTEMIVCKNNDESSTAHELNHETGPIFPLILIKTESAEMSDSENVEMSDSEMNSSTDKKDITKDVLQLDEFCETCDFAGVDNEANGENELKGAVFVPSLGNSFNVSKRGRSRKIVYHLERKCKSLSVQNNKSERVKDKSTSSSSMLNTLEQCDRNKTAKRNKNVASLNRFKEMLKEWPNISESNPGFFKENVTYGSFLKPTAKPDDLDDNYYSVSKDGYYCSNCSLLFRQLNTFIRHRVKSEGKCYYECDVCLRKYMVESEMLVHQKYHSDQRSHACNMCDKRFKKKNKLNLHIQQNHLDQRSYICYICGQSFKIKPSFDNHLKYVHIKDSEKEHLCSLCPKKYKTSASLREHLKSHTADCSFSCENCGKVFKTDYLLKRHKRRHIQTRKHTCSTCGKSFFHLYHLKTHSLLHTGVKPFECDMCPYKSTVKWNLEKHKKIHNKV